MSKIQNNEYDLPGKQKCELLKVIRELIAQKNGIEYEIEASGVVTLEGGFNVEKGATFAVYPSCF